MRKELGLTMEEFGKKFKNTAHKSIVSKWEKGLTKPSNERLKEIADLGNVSINQLLYGDFLGELENIASEEVTNTLNDNNLEIDDYEFKSLMSSVSRLIVTFYERGEENFDINLFKRLLRHYIQLDLDLGNRDLDSLTYFAFQRTINAQELVVDYYEDSKAKKFLENKEIKEFLFTISDKYDELMRYIDDYREKYNLERISEE
ncbi:MULTISPECIES: transcriptional regulator [Staphylococcus]|uniref:transcriptional regulator n=1 Tax=Staphylococcus TaxID=1279 RepID=UPI0021B6DDC5|nr:MULTISPECIES: transcriptional regulator [Staphylococcus]MDS4006602.1 helix-turn-helix domain-containing protein [Staphylococcus capitis]